MEAEHDIDAPPIQHRDIKIGTIATISQDDVARVQAVPKAAKQGVFSGFLATGRADRRLQHNPRCQAENDDQPRQWKAQPGGLGPTLRMVLPF